MLIKKEDTTYNKFAPYYIQAEPTPPRMTTISEPALHRLYEIEKAAWYLLQANDITGDCIINGKVVYGLSVLKKAVQG